MNFNTHTGLQSHQKKFEKFKEEIFQKNLKHSEILNLLYNKAKDLNIINSEDYKFCVNYFAGSSDIATLLAVGIGEDNKLKTDFVYFGEDGSYKCYILCKSQEVPKHYEKLFTFKNCLKIYDDEQVTMNFWADKIEIYRAGEMGFLIKLI